MTASFPRALRFITRCALLAAAVAASAGDAGDGLRVEAETADASRILSSAFANRYEVDTLSELTLVVRSRTGQERRREFRTASKIINGRMHSIGRMLAPEHLRGMTVLVIESDSDTNESFVFLPSMRRVKRITTAQRNDAFLGSDLTYEDFERQRIDHYRAELAGREMVGGETAHRVRARPRRPSSFEYVEFLLAVSDRAILEARYFKRGEETPYRLVRTPREAMVAERGHVLPTRILVENRARGTTTEVVIHSLEIAAKIDDRLFSLTTLDQQRELPAPSG